MIDLNRGTDLHITVRLVLEVCAGLMTLVLAYSKMLIYFAGKRITRPHTNDKALLEVALKSARRDNILALNTAKEECDENVKQSYRNGFQEGEKEGHSKGYEAGKVDSTKNYRIELADFLQAESMRIRQQVEDVEEQTAFNEATKNSGD